ncbi:bacteriohemerythrin [Thiovibrio sp. JS02]
MADFAWQDALSIGNEMIDQEHRRLIALANEVLRFANRGEGIERIKQAVVALYAYVNTHFRHEEEYMASIGYPQLAEHRILHQDIIHEMNTIMKHSGNLDALSYKLKRLMHVWVLEHIGTEDRKIAPPRRTEGAAGGDAP